jgi:hypothetical protein
MTRDIEVICHECGGCGREAGHFGLSKIPCSHCNSKGFVIQEEWEEDENKDGTEDA